MGSFTAEQRGSFAEANARISNASGLFGEMTPKKDIESGDDNGVFLGEDCSIFMLIVMSGPRLAINMAWAAQWAGIGPYLSNLLPPYAVYITSLIGPLTGIIVGPTVGLYSDRCTSKYGRRRPFLLVGAILSVLSWVGMAFTKDIGQALGDPAPGEEGTRTWTAVFTIFFYLWMDITCNFVQTPSQLIIADLAGSRQTLGQAIGGAAATIGMMLVAGFIAVIGPAQNHLTLFLAFLAVIMMGTTALTCILCKETPLQPEDVPEGKTNLCTALQLIWKGVVSLPKNLMIYAVMLLFLCYGNTAYTGMKGQFFGEVVFQGDPNGADQCGDNCTQAQKDYSHGTQLAGGTTDILYNICGVLWALALGPLVKKFGSRPVMICAMIPLMLLIPMSFTRNVNIVVTLVVLTNITQLTGLNMAVPHIVNEIQDVRDQRLGLYTGAINSANCVGQFLNFMIGAAIVNTGWGYRLPVFVGGCMGFCAFMTALLFLKTNFRF